MRRIAALHLVEVEVAGLDGQPADLDGVARVEAPARRAGRVDVDVLGALQGDGLLDLVVEVERVGRGGRGHVVDAVGGHDGRHVLLLLQLALEGRVGGDGSLGSGARALHAGVHVALVVVAHEQEVVAALGRP